MSNKVVVEIDGKALIAEDGVTLIKTVALNEIRMQHHYDDQEMEFVEKDPTFCSSCEKMFLKVRDAASAREFRDARVQDKGATPSHKPFRWKVPIRYERPGTRGMFNRLMKE